MSKTKIVDQIIKASGVSRADAERQFDAVTAAIGAVVREDGKATIPEFGTFEKRLMNARETRNPRTGETIHVAAHQALRFRASKKFAL